MATLNITENKKNEIINDLLRKLEKTEPIMFSGCIPYFKKEAKRKNYKVYQSTWSNYRVICYKQKFYTKYDLSKKYIIDSIFHTKKKQRKKNKYNKKTHSITHIIKDYHTELLINFYTPTQYKEHKELKKNIIGNIPKPMMSKIQLNFFNTYKNLIIKNLNIYNFIAKETNFKYIEPKKITKNTKTYTQQLEAYLIDLFCNNKNELKKYIEKKRNELNRAELSNIEKNINELYDLFQKCKQKD